MTRLRVSQNIMFTILIASAPAFAQQPQRDPQAATLLARSFAAMGGANLATIQDTQATARVTVMQDGNPITVPTSLKTLGTRMLRIDSDTPAGRSVFAMNEQRAAASVPLEGASSIPRRSIASAGITHLPVLSILSDWADSAIKMEYVGLEKDGGQTVHHVRLQRRFAADFGLGEFDAPCEVFLDAQTLLVTRLVYSLRPPANMRVTIPMEVRYDDYRSVNGLLVPFHVTNIVRGQVFSEHRIQTFAVNQGAQASDFEVR